MLTTEQLQTLKTAILADQSASTMYAEGNLGGLADYYNAPASPSFWVWRDSVSQDEIMQNGFDWVRVDNLSVGKARIWEWLFANEARAINPSKVNVRAGIDEAWKGTAADLAVRAAIYVHCRRAASRVEKLLATGAGSEAAPALMSFVGPMSYTDLIGL
jgi:hypothetical protein